MTIWSMIKRKVKTLQTKAELLISGSREQTTGLQYIGDYRRLRVLSARRIAHPHRAPSTVIGSGEYQGQSILFLTPHGRGHQLLQLLH